MKTFDYVITDEIGIHARPAGMLVKEAKETGAEGTVSCNGKRADAKKLMALMGLGVKHGDTITVTVEGDCEEEAAERLQTFLSENL